MSRNWEDPGPASSEFNLQDVMGQLVAFCPIGMVYDMATVHGTKSALRAVIVVLTGEHAGNVVPDALVFNTKIVARFRSATPGSVVLGAVVLGEGKGSIPPVDLAAVGADGRAIADAWEAANPGRLEQLISNATFHHQQEEMRRQQPQQPQYGQQQYGQQQAQQQRPRPSMNAGPWGASQAPDRPAQGWSQQTAKDMPALPGQQNWTTANLTLDSMKDDQPQSDGEVPF
jgi:hypothetical protein